MFPHEIVTLDILWREKVEAYIFLNHLVPNTGPGLITISRKEDAFFICLATAIAKIYCACSQLVGLQVLRDT
jgi:hypothetical protein